MHYSHPACYSTVAPTAVVVSTYDTSYVSTTFTGWDWVVQVMWASSDLTSFTPASAPVLGITTSTSTGTTTTTSSTSTNNTDTGAQNGLSGGAIAGIVIGVLVGIVALLGILYFFLRRRRQRMRPTSAPPAYTADAKAPFEGAGPMHELPSTAQRRSELAAEPVNTSAELHPDSVPAELYAPSYGRSAHS